MRRRLTPIERIMWTLGERTPVAGAVSARIRGRRTHDELRAALEAVRRRHPMLAIRVTGAGPMNAWITTDDVPELPLTVAEPPWEAAVAAELRKPFDAATGPLTRFVVVESDDFFDLAVVCHHVVGDGLALTYVIRDIVAHLADRLADPGQPVEAVAAPPMHDLVKALPKPPKGEPVKQSGSSWPVRPRTAAADFTLLSWELAAAEGAALPERCRAEQTSIHAALGLAGLRAMADLDGDTRRQIYSPVNMRGLLPGLPEGACGNYAVELFTWFDVTDDGEFWTAARRLKQTLRRQTAPERLLRQVRLLSLMDVLPNAVLGGLLRVSCKPYPSLSFSNLGRVPFPAGHGDLRIEAIHPVAHMGTLSSGLLAAATVDDRICLTMSTTEPDRAAAEKLMSGLLDHVRAAVAHRPA